MKETNIVFEIQDVNMKVSSLEKAIKELQNDKDRFAFEANEKSSLSILPKANTLKRAAIHKEGNLRELKLKKAKLMELRERL